MTSSAPARDARAMIKSVTTTGPEMFAIRYLFDVRNSTFDIYINPLVVGQYFEHAGQRCQFYECGSSCSKEYPWEMLF